eukprot:XP_024999834.1 proline-rich protein 29 isoform X3 [Gallus gallus]
MGCCWRVHGGAESWHQGSPNTGTRAQGWEELTASVLCGDKTIFEGAQPSLVPPLLWVGCPGDKSREKQPGVTPRATQPIGRVCLPPAAIATSMSCRCIAAHPAMELGAAGNASGVWGDAAEGTNVIPHRLPPVPVSQQPLTIIQQLPMATAPPTGPPHLWGDLFELMMIQNSQMHQVVMNSLAVSALVSFGFGPSPITAQPGEEEEAVVFHHHYISYPSSAPLWAWPLQDQAMGPAAVRHLGTATEDREVPVPPPPPPSATGTVGANVPPASGNTFSPYLHREVLH